MNVQDIEFIPESGDKLVKIFEKQLALAEKYHVIEKEQGVGYGLLGDKGFHIDDIRSQALLKDFAWRVTEELAESTECYPRDGRPLTSSERDHMLEEIADSLHFLVELCLLIGITPTEIVNALPNPEIHPDGLVALCSVKFTVPNVYSIIQELGLAMNCLKQKPWKKTHILTDEQRFRGHVICAFHELCRYWVCCGSNADKLYEFYFKKNKVNQFRQKTNY